MNFPFHALRLNPLCQVALYLLLIPLPYQDPEVQTAMQDPATIQQIMGQMEGMPGDSAT
jgi:hypothetical protein